MPLTNAERQARWRTKHVARFRELEERFVSHNGAQPFIIVAEVSKNWLDGEEATPGTGILAEQFERLIAHNGARGYRLLQFQLHRMMTGPNSLNETIIAAFQRVP